MNKTATQIVIHAYQFLGRREQKAVFNFISSHQSGERRRFIIQGGIPDHLSIEEQRIVEIIQHFATRDDRKRK